LKEEMIRITCADAWSEGRVPGGTEGFGVFIAIHLTSSFRCCLIRIRACDVLIGFDTPMPF